MNPRLVGARVAVADRLADPTDLREAHVEVVPCERRLADRILVEDRGATEAEMRDGRYTGRVQGVPCYREGKVERLKAWMTAHGETLEDSWFYSDSHNDLPLLSIVDHAVAVNPDDILRAETQTRGWRILQLD